MTSTIADRIKLLIEYYYDGNRLRFCCKTGIPMGTLSAILTNKRNPGFQFIVAVLTDMPDLNTTWLLTGYGEIKIIDVVELKKKIASQEALIIFLKENQK